MKLTAGHDLGWSPTLCLERAWAQSSLWYYPTFHTILSAIILWHDSLAQPCPKNCTGISGIHSNNNTQRGLLSLIKVWNPSLCDLLPSSSQTKSKVLMRRILPAKYWLLTFPTGDDQVTGCGYKDELSSSSRGLVSSRGEKNTFTCKFMASYPRLQKRLKGKQWYNLHQSSVSTTRGGAGLVHVTFPDPNAITVLCLVPTQ